MPVLSALVVVDIGYGAGPIRARCAGIAGTDVLCPQQQDDTDEKEEAPSRRPRRE